MSARPRLLYLVTEDWYFCSHRLPMARAARDAGAEVVVATRDTGQRQEIEAEGFRMVPLSWSRGGASPLGELRALWDVIRVYRRERPALAHHVAMKPILYGSIAGWLAGVPAVVNAATGLGYFFISGAGLKTRLVRAALRFGLNRPTSTVLAQNEQDAATLREEGLLHHGRVAVIRGSGVDVAAFQPGAESEGRPKAALVARMLWDKGVGELVEAARLLRARGVALDVDLVGPVDPENPRGIPDAQLQAWTADGVVRWRGPVRDIAGLWRDTAIAVLPSYREGLPKSLLEAAAAGRALVAADVPGCREIVRHRETGLLVPARDPEALADALSELAQDPDLRARLGAAARELAEQAFSQDLIADETLALYRRLLPSGALP